MATAGSILPPYFTLLISGLIAVSILMILGRLWLTIRRKTASASTIAATPHDVPLAQRSILTPSEAKVFRVLQDAVGSQYAIFPQLSLWTLIDIPNKDCRDAAAFRNRISQKRVDFVLVDPATLKTQMVIELDDRSHKREDRMTRDAFVENVLNRAGIKLVRIPVASTYESRTLRSRLGLTVLKDLSA
jgi:Protein of unknown function (DUF2726)